MIRSNDHILKAYFIIHKKGKKGVNSLIKRLHNVEDIFVINTKNIGNILIMYT